MRPGPDHRRDAGAAYCPQCGTRVDAGANYCSSCGASQEERRRRRSGGERARADTERREYESFRRRVRDWVAGGWEIEYDAGDEVVLVDRDIGSIPIHVALLLTTGGVGNLAYGWYKYSKDADRVVLRPDDNVRRTGNGPTSGPPTESASAVEYETDGDDSSLGRHVAGICLFGFAALLLATGVFDPAQIVIGLTVLFAAVYVFPPTRRRIENRHPVTAFGPTRTVDERVVTDTDRPCSVCLSEIDRGIAREYTEEYAVAGIPLSTTETGENYYCAACATGEREATSEGETASAGESETAESETPDEPIAAESSDSPARSESDREGEELERERGG